jgi:DNA-binding NtrC family response regulator
VLERAVALSATETITVADLPDVVSREYRDLLRVVPGRDDSLRAWSSRYVRLVLDRCGGNKRRACDVLAISYHTLQAHLAYGKGRGRAAGAKQAEVRSGVDASAGADGPGRRASQGRG